MYSCYSHYSNSNIVKSGPGFQTVIRIEDQKIFSKCTKGIPYCCQKYQYRKVTQSSCDVKMMTLSLFILRKKFQGLRALYASLSLIEKKKKKRQVPYSRFQHFALSALFSSPILVFLPSVRGVIIALVNIS